MHCHHEPGGPTRNYNSYAGMYAVHAALPLNDFLPENRPETCQIDRRLSTMRDTAAGSRLVYK